MTGENRHGNSGRGIYKHARSLWVQLIAVLPLRLRGTPRSSPHRSLALAAIPLAVVALVSCTSSPESSQESGAQSGDGSAAICGTEVTPVPEPTRQINLVLDESGSMFVDAEEQPVTWWSIAKYSLEVFAALLGPGDTLNVYRMSDYGRNSSSDPTLVISGSESVATRVESVHTLQLQGRSTPWRSVTAAAENLAASSASEKWLVILTDGVFDSPEGAGQQIPVEEVEGFLDQLSQETSTEVAFMSIGTGATVVSSTDSRRAVSVSTSDEVLQTMTAFANSTFGRNVVPASDLSGNWTPDIPLSEVTIFAQGSDVVIGVAETSNGEFVDPSETAAVSWVDNPIPLGGGQIYDPPPDTSLEGVIATYKEIPSGPINFGIENASQVDIFYKPDVRFGYSILDAQGQDVANILDAEATYTLNYSFIDANCTPVESDLLNPVVYSATVFEGGNPLLSDLVPGSTLQLPATTGAGDGYSILMEASYKGGISSAQFPLFVGGRPEIAYPVSSLADFTPPDRGIPYSIVVKPTDATGSGQGSLARDYTAAEWAALDPAAVAFESDSNLEFEFLKGATPGQATVLVRAPEGEVFAADTGPVTFTVTLPAQKGIQETTLEPTTFDVVDDISALDRFWHWFWTVGIWILVAIALLILALGYLLKKRFPRKLKKRPTIEGIPRVIGQQRLNGRGQFQVNGLRRILPFVADTGTLKYVPPGTMGFRPMQVKAGPRKMLRLTNWKEIAKQANVQVNGSPLDDSTMKEPMFGASAMITADTPQMSFEMTPSQ